MSVPQQNESQLLQGAQDSLNRHIYEFLNAASMNGSALNFAKECQACIVTPGDISATVNAAKPPPVFAMMPSPATSNPGPAGNSALTTTSAAEGPAKHLSTSIHDPTHNTALGQWWKTFWEIFNANAGNSGRDATDLAAQYYNIMCQDQKSGAGSILVEAATAVANGESASTPGQPDHSPSPSQIFTPLKYTGAKRQVSNTEVSQKNGGLVNANAISGFKRSTQWEIEDISPGALVVSTINGTTGDSAGGASRGSKAKPSLQFENVSFSTATSMRFVDASQVNSNRESQRQRMYSVKKQDNAPSTVSSSSSVSSFQPLTTTFQTTGWVKQFADTTTTSKPLKKKSSKKSATLGSRTQFKPRKFEFSTAADPELSAVIAGSAKRRGSTVSARGKSKKPSRSMRSSTSSSSSHLTPSTSSTGTSIHMSTSAVSLPTHVTMQNNMASNNHGFIGDMNTPHQFKAEEDPNTALTFFNDIMGKPMSLDEEYSNSHRKQIPNGISDYSFEFKEEQPDTGITRQYISSGASTVCSDASGIADTSVNHIDFHHISPHPINASPAQSLQYDHNLTMSSRESKDDEPQQQLMDWS